MDSKELLQTVLTVNELTPLAMSICGPGAIGSIDEQKAAQDANKAAYKQFLQQRPLTLPSKLTRERILDFEASMARHPTAEVGNQDRMPLRHSFAGPIYIREILIPKGMIATGRIHRFEHAIFFMSGDVSVFDEHTGSTRIKAPCHFVSKPGTKRVLYTHEDTIIVTVHFVGEERDTDKIEAMVSAWTYEDYEKGPKCQEIQALSNG